MDQKIIKPIKFSFCHSSFIYNSVQNYKNKTLILDTRDCDSFIKNQIPDSINVSNDRVQRFLQTFCDGNELSRVTATSLTNLFDTTEAPKYQERKRRFCLLIMSETPITRELVTEMKTIAEVDEEAESFEISETCLNDAIRALLERVQEESSVLLALELFKILQKDRVQELHILVDGSADFFEKYPYMKQSFSNPMFEDTLAVSKLFKPYEFPHDILDGKLFLGSFEHARQYDLLNKLHVTHVVNAAYECNNMHEDKGLKYLKLFIRDETEDCISQHYREAWEFINQVFEEGRNSRVLVHCAMGKSRSAIIVIMYVMKKFSWPFEKALKYVKERRKLVSPFHGFEEELKTFEKHEFDFEKCNRLELVKDV